MIYAASADSSTTEGGNITGVDIEPNLTSIWYGVCGQTTGDPFVPVVINATPGDIACLTIDLGTDPCWPPGLGIIHLLFSNSSENITSLEKGNLTVLDDFIGRPDDNGTATFPFVRAYATWQWGTITGVPSTYTIAYNPTVFPMGYLQDQSGNLVFITPVKNDEIGYNGSEFDFQLMLPTMNGTPVQYYVTADYKCQAPPTPPAPSGGGGGGGGSGVPVYNESRAPPEEPGPPEPEIPGLPEGIPGCQMQLSCEEWQSCVDGYRYQKCIDNSTCTNLTIYRVQECPPAEPESPIEAISQEILRIPTKEELPCLLPLALIATIILILLLLYLRRRKDKDRGIPR